MTVSRVLGVGVGVVVGVVAQTLSLVKTPRTPTSGLQSSTLTATPTDYAPARARAELRIVDAQIAVEDACAELRLALGDYHGLLSAQLDELERLEVAA